MIWFAWFMLALESLVIAIGLWLMWAMVSEASREPGDAFRSLEEPQYAWDYASVRLADKALAYAEFNTHPTEGIIGVDDIGRGPYPAAEPGQYLRRWKYTSGGRMERSQ